MEQISAFVENWKWVITLAGFGIGLLVRMYVVIGERRRRQREREAERVDPFEQGALRSVQRRMENYF